MNWKVRGDNVAAFIRLSHIVIISLLLLPASLVYAAAKDNSPPRTVRVILDNNYPPYVFQASNGTIQGILIDQWQLFEKKTGIHVEITATDWASAQKAMKAGEYDVIDTIFVTDERRGWLDFSEPYARIDVPVFFNREISGISDIASLHGFVVATKKGDAAVDYLQNHGVNNLMLFDSYEEIIQAAKDHKVNVFVVDKPPALYFLYKMGIHDQYQESSPLYTGEFHRAVKKGDSLTLQEIENGFSRISAKDLEQIEKKWYGSAILHAFPLGYTLTGIGLLLLIVTGLSLWNRSLRKAVETRTSALKASEERYRLLFNVESDAILLVDIESLSHVEVNDAAVDLYGYSPEEFIALRTTDLSADTEESMLELTLQDGHVNIPLRYHRKKDGTVFPVEITARIFQFAGRKLVLATMRDISDRLKAEEELRESRSFLSDLIENSGALIFVKDRDGLYTLINRKWEEVTGLKRETVLGRTDEELFPGDIGRQFRRNDLEVIEADQVLEKEEILENENDRRFFLSIKFPLHNNEGSVSGVCGMTTEITGRKQAEADRERLSEQLAQAYKMESIGRLAGGVAHDFNNMLGVILGHTELALLSSPAPGPLQSSLKEIRKAAQRSADLTQQLLAFARKQTVVPKVLDLNERVNSMMTILQRLIGEDIELVWFPAESLWPIRMDPSQIDQILANLCANARDAIEGVGKVSISTENFHTDATFCHNKEGCREGDFVLLSISDTGCGMDGEAQNKLFEPFYTTKEVGKGTGLGLAMVYGIVQQNNGFLMVDSSPGRGTIFKLFLPRHDTVLPSSPVEKPDETLILGTETILLVEDEHAILEMASLMLEQMGYRVIKAHSPLETINLVQKHQGKIDLLMTDVIMPEMSGWELAKKLKPIQPAMKQLFTSGYTSTTIPPTNVMNGDVHFIQKPFTMLDLSVKVREALHPQERHQIMNQPDTG